jgi:hypothetical protein
MTAALLAVRIKVTNLYGLAATFLPLNWHIDVVHIYLPSQRPLLPFMVRGDGIIQYWKTIPFFGFKKPL